MKMKDYLGFPVNLTDTMRFAVDLDGNKEHFDSWAQATMKVVDSILEDIRLPTEFKRYGQLIDVPAAYATLKAQYATKLAKVEVPQVEEAARV